MTSPEFEASSIRAKDLAQRVREKLKGQSTLCCRGSNLSTYNHGILELELAVEITRLCPLILQMRKLRSRKGN